MKSNVRIGALATLAFGLMAAPAMAQQADVNGTWALAFDSPEVGPVAVNVMIEQDGAAFTGTGEVMGYGLELSDGVVDGSEITFLIHVDVDGQWFTLELEAEANGDEMAGSVSAEGMSSAFTGSRAGDA